MTDGEALLAAVLAEPQDDGIRLAFADWLEERGDPRGEFVRVQIELARMDAGFVCLPDVEWGECRAALRRRERELLVEPRNLVAWTPSVLHTGPGAGICVTVSPHVGLTGKGFGGVTFRRGFPAAVSCTLAAWAEYGPALVRACPLEEVRLTDRAAVMSANTPPVWVWESRDAHEGLGQPSFLPRELFERLPDTRPHDSWRWARRCFPTAAAADAALSAACLLQAKAATPAGA